MIQINPNRNIENNFPDSTPKTATDKFTTLDGGLVNSLTVEMTPIQDLHGQSKPWAEGAGKNIMPLVLSDIKGYNTSPSWTWSDNKATHTKGFTVEVLVDSDDNVTGFKVGGSTNSPDTNYYAFKLTGYVRFTNGVPYSVNGVNSPSQTSYRLNVSGIDNYISGDNNITGDGYDHIFNIQFYGSATDIDGTMYPMLRLASIADPTFEPYSNICPISGHTEAKAYLVGKNKFNTDTIISGGSLFSGTDDDFTISGTGSNQASAFVVDVQPNTNYTLSCSLVLVSGKGTIAIATYDNSSTIYTSSTYTESQSNISFSFNSASETKLRIKCFCTRSTSESGNAEYKKMMIRLASDSDSTFEPYNGRTYTTSLGTTVYGGELDMVSGEGEVTIARVDLGSLSYNYDSANLRYTAYLSGIKDVPVRTMPIKSDIYETIDDGRPYSGAWDNVIYNSGNTVIIHNHAYTDAAAFKTAMSGYYITYILATPTTLTLTGQNITAEVGENNVSAPLDGQEIQTDGVTYKEMFSWADVVAYVQSQVNP